MCSNHHNTIQSTVVSRSIAPVTSSMMMPKTCASLIDNSLAQYCSRKRSRESITNSTKVTKSDSDGVVSSPKRVKVPNADASAVKTILSTSSLINQNELCPYDFIQHMIDEDANQDPPISTNPLHESEFLPLTNDQINAFNTLVVTAVRTSDVITLRKLLSQGQDLRCGNRFGESLLHIACRRSTAEVVSFLLNDANVSPRIKDDYGRTPLHDACWRGTPDYKVVELLLSKEPRLAFVKDVRGHKPFQYARREHWAGWREFLGRKRHLILCNKP
mmetsp:Transcript_2548/g.5477  ORF Transcript_2548/g.5477 Transcript_2548/m.5477 type:complete len:274 (-) Transcript_2548:71-892(-)